MKHYREADIKQRLLQGPLATVVIFFMSYMMLAGMKLASRNIQHFGKVKHMFGVLQELLAWFYPFHHAVHDVLVGIQLARTYSIVLHVVHVWT